MGYCSFRYVQTLLIEKEREIKHFFDDGGHVVVLVFGEATTEEDSLSPTLPNREGGCILWEHNTFLVSEFAVGFYQSVVAVVVHRVVGFHAFLVFRTVLFADNGLGTIIDFLSKHFEMLVLNDTGIGFVMTRIVDNGITLVVWGVFYMGFKGNSAPVELTIPIIEVLIELACEH